MYGYGHPQLNNQTVTERVDFESGRDTIRVWPHPSLCPHEGFSSFFASFSVPGYRSSYHKGKEGKQPQAVPAGSVAGGLRSFSCPWGDLCYLSHSESVLISAASCFK